MKKSKDSILLKYPCPRVDKNTGKPEKEFQFYWETFLPEIATRTNFHIGHLQQVKVLCDMYVEHDHLMNLIDVEGSSYESETRNGIQLKMRPEVEHLKTVRAQIAIYSKMLGLLLTKSTNIAPTKEKDDWE